MSKEFKLRHLDTLSTFLTNIQQVSFYKSMSKQIGQIHGDIKSARVRIESYDTSF
jgi:hypothetical protein